ncbi:hypothetical protein [Arcticibacterium luteifluviistationis]|uniref:Transmembrane protein n=1 Tax=Arcticibacterium luteifluviistationis TaxID=1784714 RepID=A0A2Z4G8P2_9BACT|nr:hypothetical protein [Arcticibacterium luteifluviistationis]AWV97526.1 hypothetical protein DJ013_04840 [Arcticibacterium luteifluviistationis]
MKYFIIGLILSISPLFSFGHNSLSAKYQLEAGENASLLTISLSQDGMNQVLIKEHGRQKLENLDKKELEELIVNYIKKHFELTIDKKVMDLKDGGIKLGSHQTDLKFILPPISKNAENLEINISAFKENENHQTIFYYLIYDKGGHLILSNINDYQADLSLKDDSSKNLIWSISAVLAGMVLLFILFRKYYA